MYNQVRLYAFCYHTFINLSTLYSDRYLENHPLILTESLSEIYFLTKYILHLIQFTLANFCNNCYTYIIYYILYRCNFCVVIVLWNNTCFLVQVWHQTRSRSCHVECPGAPRGRGGALTGRGWLKTRMSPNPPLWRS